MLIDTQNVVADAGCFDQPAAARAVDADGVRFVHDERRARGSAERRVLGERRDVAVHAEERFDDDEAVPTLDDVSAVDRCLREQLCQPPDIVVRKHDARRRRQPDAVDQAGVVALVREDDVAPLGDRRQHGDVREIAARKVQRALGALEIGEPPLDRREDVALAAQQTRPGAPASLALTARASRSTMIGWVDRFR